MIKCIKNYIRKIICVKSKTSELRLVVLLMVLGFNACAGIWRPKPEDLNNTANYGEPPLIEAEKELTRTYLKSGGYFDPNSAEIENCSEPMKHWERDAFGFKYGWRFTCSVNSKNKFGGYTGFQTVSMYYKNGRVLSLTNPLRY